MHEGVSFNYIFFPFRCECRSSDHCPMLECAGGLTSQIMLHATRQPGYCCDVMQCINSKYRLTYMYTIMYRRDINFILC